MLSLHKDSVFTCSLSVCSLSALQVSAEHSQQEEGLPGLFHYMSLFVNKQQSGLHTKLIVSLHNRLFRTVSFTILSHKSVNTWRGNRLTGFVWVIFDLIQTVHFMCNCVYLQLCIHMNINTWISKTYKCNVCTYSLKLQQRKTNWIQNSTNIQIFK